MTKFLTNYQTYLKNKEFVDGVILGVENLTVNFQDCYPLEMMKEIIPRLKSDEKEVFVALNKNMHAADLEELEHVMRELESYEVTGILYYDIALVTIKKDQNLKTPLVWAQEHLTTNYMTCNYWHTFGADYAYLSGEITMDEIVEIKKNTQMKLIVPIFGRLPMFVSRRHLVDNYLTFFDLEKKNTTFQIEKEGYRYPIIDNELGTVVFSSYYLNGLTESISLKEAKIDYFYFNFDGIEEKSTEVLEAYHNVNEKNQAELEQKIDTLLEGNTDKGFLYKETVYKVK